MLLASLLLASMLLASSPSPTLLFPPSFLAYMQFASLFNSFCASCVFVVVVTLDMDPSKPPSVLLEMDDRNPTTSHDCTSQRGLAANDHPLRLELRPAPSTKLDPCPTMFHPSEVFPENTENDNAPSFLLYSFSIEGLMKYRPCSIRFRKLQLPCFPRSPDQATHHL